MPFVSPQNAGFWTSLCLDRHLYIPGSSAQRDGVSSTCLYSGLSVFGVEKVELYRRKELKAKQQLCFLLQASPQSDGFS